MSGIHVRSGSTPYFPSIFPSPFSLLSFSLCLWLSSPDSGLPSKSCFWCWRVSLGSGLFCLISAAVWGFGVFVKLPEAVFPPVELQSGSFVSCAHVRVKCAVRRDTVFGTQGTFRSINWACSVSHSSQLPFSHWLISQRSSETWLLHQTMTHFYGLCWP